MRILSDRFTYQDKQFIAESSDFCRGNKDLFHSLYQDACDEGITIVSAKTFAEVDYFVDEYKQDDHGWIWAWLLKPTEDSLRKHPTALGTSVLIFND